MDLKELCELAPRGQAILAINAHKTYSESIKDYISDLDGGIDVHESILKQMEQTNTLITVSFYENTFFDDMENVHHYDIDKAIEIAIRRLKKL